MYAMAIVFQNECRWVAMWMILCGSVKNSLMCSRNCSCAMAIAVSLIPGPKHMIGPFLKFRPGEFHLRWWELDCWVPDFDCLSCCGWSSNRGSCRQKGSSPMASCTLACLVLQIWAAGSSSLTAGSDSIELLLGIIKHPYWPPRQCPLTGRERLPVTSLMNYFPWYRLPLIVVVTACLSYPLFQRDVV